MYFFIILPFLLLLGSLIRPRSQSIYLLFSYFTLLLLSAFREVRVGTDTEHYEDLFYTIANNNSDSFRVEPGWVFLNKLIVFQDFDFRAVLVLSSFITLTLIFIIVKKYSSNPMLSISFFYLLYFYFFSFNISRQMLAVSIVLMGIIFLLKDKRILFFISIFLASLFHQTALIAFLLYFYNKISNQKFFIIFFIILSMFFGVFGVSILRNIIGYTNYSLYVDNYDISGIIGKSFLLILFNAFFIYIILSLKKFSSEFKIFYLFIIMFNLTVLIPFGSRLILYFSVYQILFYPYFLVNLNQNTKNFKLISIFMLILYSFFVFIISFGDGGIFPYSNTLF